MVASTTPAPHIAPVRISEILSREKIKNKKRGTFTINTNLIIVALK
jgi:hypothetical protein